MTHLYPKIQTLYRRDENHKVVSGQYSRPEFALIKFGGLDVTEKLDGMNLSYHYDTEADSVVMRGRTLSTEFRGPWVKPLQDIRDGLYDGMRNIAHFHGIKSFTIFGEAYGPGIQNGGDYSDVVSFSAFDMMAEDAWLSVYEFQDNAEKLHIETTPEILFYSESQIDEFVQHGFSSYVGGKKRAEGIVAKPYIPLFDRRGNRIIWKLKTKDFAVDKS